MRISDWSSDVCSSDLQVETLMTGVSLRQHAPAAENAATAVPAISNPFTAGFVVADRWSSAVACSFTMNGLFGDGRVVPGTGVLLPKAAQLGADNLTVAMIANNFNGTVYFASNASGGLAARSEEHTSELPALMRISYAVFCLKKKKPNSTNRKSQ